VSDAGSSVRSIAIASGFLNLTGEYPIGGVVSSIALGPSTSGIALECFASDGVSCLTAPFLNATGVALTGVTNSSTFFNVDSTSLDSFSFFGQYRGASLREQLTGISFVHFGRISLNATVLLVFTSASHERNVTVVANGINGLLISLPAPGDYAVSVLSSGHRIGALCASSECSFAISDGDNFFPEVSLRPVATPTATSSADHSPSGFVIAAAVLCPAAAVAALIAVYCLVRRGRRDGRMAGELIADNDDVSGFSG
jgi:hypothetical protein